MSSPPKLPSSTRVDISLNITAGTKSPKADMIDMKAISAIAVGIFLEWSPVRLMTTPLRNDAPVPYQTQKAFQRSLKQEGHC